MSEIGRRFSLDKASIDPKLKNRIFSADGDDHIGDWDGECIDDLIKELERIEERMDPNYSSLPHSYNIPDDLKNEIGKDYPIWTCDKKGRCLVGDTGSEIMTFDEIRNHYINKYGSIEKFKEKLRIEEEGILLQLSNIAFPNSIYPYVIIRYFW